MNVLIKVRLKVFTMIWYQFLRISIFVILLASHLTFTLMKSYLPRKHELWMVTCVVVHVTNYFNSYKCMIIFFRYIYVLRAVHRKTFIIYLLSVPHWGHVQGELIRHRYTSINYIDPNVYWNTVSFLGLKLLTICPLQHQKTKTKKVQINGFLTTYT